MSCMSIVGSHFRSLIQIFSNDILWNQNVLQVVDVFAEGGHDTWTDVSQCLHEVLSPQAGGQSADAFL